MGIAAAAAARVRTERGGEGSSIPSSHKPQSGKERVLFRDGFIPPLERRTKRSLGTYPETQRHHFNISPDPCTIPIVLDTPISLPLSTNELLAATNTIPQPGSTTGSKHPSCVCADATFIENTDNEPSVWLAPIASAIAPSSEPPSSPIYPSSTLHSAYSQCDSSRGTAYSFHDRLYSSRIEYSERPRRPRSMFTQARCKSH